MTLEMILRTAGLESLAPRLRAAGVTDPRQLSDSLLQQLGVDDAAARAALLQAMARVADPLVAGGATMHAAAPGPSTPLSLDALAIGATMHEGVAQASAMSDADRAASNSREPAVRDAIGEGTKLNGRYYLVKEIGRGAMGVVYKAIDEATKEECAIKVILPELADSPGIVDLMIQEAARAQKLRSEHLLSINHVETGHQPFIVMEYVDGGTLTDLWRDHRRQMPPADVQRILGQVLEGLTFLHGRKLIHRDIKPDNIMIGRDGSVKVADYGVAASLREQRRNSQAAGTPVYMAPELLAGDPDVDGRADLYALGMMGHQLLLGGFPFTGTSLDDIRAWHSSPRRDLGALTAAPCGAVFAKALSHDPRERFQSASEMRDALLATAANSGAPAPFVGSAPIPSFATAPTIPPASPPPPATVPPPESTPVTPVVAVRSSAESSPASGRSVGLPLMAVALAIVGGGIWQWRSSTGREETARAAELQKQAPATTATTTTAPATTTTAPNTTAPERMQPSEAEMRAPIDELYIAWGNLDLDGYRDVWAPEAVKIDLSNGKRYTVPELVASRRALFAKVANVDARHETRLRSYEDGIATFDTRYSMIITFKNGKVFREQVKESYKIKRSRERWLITENRDYEPR